MKAVPLIAHGVYQISEHKGNCHPDQLECSLQAVLSLISGSFDPISSYLIEFVRGCGPVLGTEHEYLLKLCGMIVHLWSVNVQNF